MDELTDAILKIAVISSWNIEGAFQSPICITWLLNVPSTVANTVLWTFWYDVYLFICLRHIEL